MQKLNLNIKVNNYNLTKIEINKLPNQGVLLFLKTLVLINQQILI